MFLFAQPFLQGFTEHADQYVTKPGINGKVQVDGAHSQLFLCPLALQYGFWEHLL